MLRVKVAAELFPHHFEQLAGAGGGDLLDGQARKLPVADAEVAVEP